MLVFALGIGFYGVSLRAQPTTHASACNITGPGGCLGQWRFSGADLDNTRYAAHESTISASSVGTLAPKWVFITAGDVSATPTVFAGTVYVPNFGGYL